MNDNTTADSRRRFALTMLESYFMLRCNMPKQGYLRENKTTLQIMDDLRSMMELTEIEVICYMMEHGYLPISEDDGTVAWSVWRMGED